MCKSEDKRKYGACDVQKFGSDFGAIVQNVYGQFGKEYQELIDDIERGNQELIKWIQEQDECVEQANQHAL